MLGEMRCMCGGRAPPVEIEGADDAAAPTGFPQSMQYSDSGEFERPQNAQASKLGPPGSTP